MDTQEPRTEPDPEGGLRVVLPQATHEAHLAYVASGMLSAAQDEALGGMQLPFTVEAAANSFFALASVSINTSMLTVGNANLLMAHGSAAQQKVFAHNEFSGRWAGTMCLSEPQAGSSLGDISTRAVPDGPDFAGDALGARYRLRGSKMWISAGDHELTENIVHLVLAKIPERVGHACRPASRASRCLSCPRRLVDAQGAVDRRAQRRGAGGPEPQARLARHHQHAAQLWRGASTPCAAKPVPWAIWWASLARACSCMFHMMNEARIGVGMAATMLGLAGYYASLNYAKTRPQGRAVSAAGKNAAQPQSRIIEHADVKRMLLAQKSYGEGALALELYCARLIDEQHTGSPEPADEARLLLELLTPIAKSWPSEWCLEANSLAIQVHGGYGYTRDFAVEQYWRDNRLNMIHEGTHGIQAAGPAGPQGAHGSGQGTAAAGPAHGAHSSARPKPA